MRQTPCSAASSPLFFGGSGNQGHTILELLVATGMTVVIAALLSSGLREQTNVYMTDLGRKRVQHNLRSAMDIVSMNVRQAGEGLDRSFPALTLTQSIDPATSVLTLRRKLVHEVMLACKPVSQAATSIAVSDDQTTDSDCLPANVQTAVEAWQTERLAEEDDSLRIFIYDRVSHTGEFLDYNSENETDGDDFIITSPTSHAYPSASTSLYVLEEYNFFLDDDEHTLKLIVDGRTDSPDDVAYDIEQFQVSLLMKDGSAVTSLDPASTSSWQDLRHVSITLRGEERWKGVLTDHSLTAEYFPRNVLSN